MSPPKRRPPLRCSRNRPRVFHTRSELTEESPSSQEILPDGQTDVVSSTSTNFHRLSMSEEQVLTSQSSPIPGLKEDSKPMMGASDSHGNNSTDSDSEVNNVVGCTSSHEEPMWKISDSMLKALMWMRGPMGHPQAIMEDGLCEWIARCGRFWVAPSETHNDNGTCTLLLQLWASLDSDQPLIGFEDSLVQTYVVPKPLYQHLGRIVAGTNGTESIGEVFNPGDRGSIVWDESFCVSDEEGDPIEGRISPCTFRYWAQGSAKVDSLEPFSRAEGQMNDIEGSSDEDQHASGMVAQVNFEQDPGSARSWTESVRESLIENWQHAVLMKTKTPGSANSYDPSAGPEWAHKQSLSHSEGSEELQAFTDAEVYTALNTIGARRVASVSPPDIPRTISERLQKLQKLESELHDKTENFNANLEHFARQSQQFDNAFGSLTPGVLKRSHRELARRNDIYRHVSQYLRDIDKKCDDKIQEISDVKGKLVKLGEAKVDLHEKMTGAAEMMGMEHGWELDELEAKILRIRAEEDEKDMASMF